MAQCHSVTVTFHLTPSVRAIWRFDTPSIRSISRQPVVD